MRPDLSGVDALELNLATRVSVGDLLTRSAQLFGDRTAVVDPTGDEISYAELDASAEAFGRGLLGAGVQQQEPVAFLLGNSSRFITSFFGCAKAGIVALPLNLMLAPEDLGWIVTDAGARTVVVDPALLPLLEKLLAAAPGVERVVVTGEAPAEVAGRALVRWDDLAVDPTPLRVVVEDRDTLHCLYTSGTTARPKGVLTSHVSVQIATLTNALEVGHPRGHEFSVSPIVLPLFHTTALDTLLLPLLVTGGTAVLPAGFAPEAFLDLVEQRRATHIMLLPMMYGALLASSTLAGRDLGSVRLCAYAMAPMPQERVEQVAAAFPNAKVLLGSGQTECVPMTVFQWPAHQETKSSSWGPSVITVDTRIMDADGVLVGTGETGEIVYRGPHVMSGYWNNPAANAAAFAHGWLHSGDVGHLDGEGVIWFTDRLKDMVKTGGENVSSVEIERVLLSSPDLVECAVIGVPDERWGEALTAVIVAADLELAPDVLAERLIAHCREHLGGFKVPKNVRVVTALPKTATGKVQKAELRELFRG